MNVGSIPVIPLHLLSQFIHAAVLAEQHDEWTEGRVLGLVVDRATRWPSHIAPSRCSPTVTFCNVSEDANLGDRGCPTTPRVVSGRPGETAIVWRKAGEPMVVRAGLRAPHRC